MIVVDTGVLYAALDVADADHARCAPLFRRPPDALVIPLSVIAESCMLFERKRGPQAEKRFLEAMAASELTFEALDRSDLRRMAELVDAYDDLPLGAIDASIVTVAERTGATTVLTLDRRHFSIVRPRHAEAFTLLP